MISSGQLTLDKLKSMAPGIFASGVVDYEMELFHWVAVRGVIHDWAIYCGTVDMADEYIKSYGDKLLMLNSKKIRELVPCDNDAFSMYRF